MKEQIQQLIAAGQTKDALQLLVQSNGDALLLQAQFNNGEKQFNLGLIDFSEWQRIQARVNFAALEMAGKIGNSAPVAAPNDNPAGPAARANGNSRTVFISYNHGDMKVAVQARDFLQSEGLDVIFDQDDLEAGRSIMEFIQSGIKKADAVLSIVSSKSLQSGWVGQESVASIYAVWLADKKFIPVRLDDVAFDIDFHIAATEALNKQIDDLKGKIRKLEELGVDSPASRDDLSRMVELKNNMGKIIQRLTSVSLLDIGEANFEANMRRVLAAINAG